MLNHAYEGLTDGVDPKLTTVRVEHALFLPRRKTVKHPRPDLLFELRSGVTTVPSRIVIVENKIDAIDHDSQLDDYSEAASLRYPQAKLYFIYLTIHGSSPTQKVDSSWQTLSYETLALLFRRQLAHIDLREGVPRGWQDVLRLYLATIVQDLLHWNVFDQESRAARWRALRYLQAATVRENKS